jgi:DedD protein
MDPQLKQRLVGAAILVALAVIVIPAFLEQDAPAPPPVVKRDMVPMPAADFPEAPASIEPLVVDEITSGLTATGEELAARLAPPDSAASADGGATAAAPESPPAPPPAVATAKVAALPRGEETPNLGTVTATVTAGARTWVIQLGSFASQENAQKLQDKLRRAGFDAYISPLEAHGKRTYRVRIAGGSQRQEAERLHARLARELGYSGMVVKGD